MPKIISLNSLSFLLALTLALVHVQFASAQQKQPTKSEIYDLSNLVLATTMLDGDEPSIEVDALKYESVERDVKVTKLQQETRSRTVEVTDKNGDTETVTQEYTVQVPVLEQRKVSVLVPAGNGKQKIAKSKFSLFDLTGKRIAADAVNEAARNIETVFLVRQMLDRIPAADPAIQKSLNGRCLVLVTDALPAPEQNNQAAPAQVIARQPVRAAAAANFALPAMIPAARIFANGRLTKNSLYSPSNLVLAKLDTTDKSAKLVCMVEAFRIKEVERPVQRMKVEERTRTVRVIVDGKPEEREQTYRVNVPYTENTKIKTKVPAGKKPVSVNWDECRLYRIDGTELTLEDAKDALRKTRPVFLARGKDRAFESPNELFLQIASEDTLILMSDANPLFP